MPGSEENDEVSDPAYRTGQATTDDHSSNIARYLPTPLRTHSAVTGLITFFISSIRLAGKPPLLACSLRISLSGALYMQ